MKLESDTTRRLREGFAAAPQGRAGESSCPPPDRIWEAVQGALSPEETGSIVDHTVDCSECAEAWRLAREVATETPLGMATSEPARTRSLWRSRFLPLAAVAGLVLILIAPVWILREPAPPDVPRGSDLQIDSLVPEDAILPRDDFRLRWSTGPEGSAYRLTLTTPTLEILLDRSNLQEPTFLVPPETLSGLPSSSRVHWQVEMTAPDGTVSRSSTFVAKVE